MEKQQQYKWRKRKKSNMILMIWLIGVALLAAGAAFVYEGTKDSSPENEARQYVKEVKKVQDFTLEAGDQSVDGAGMLTQQYTLNYTKEGEQVPVSEGLEVIRGDEKKFGMFERWAVNPDSNKVKDFQLIVPAGITVLLDGVEVEETLLFENESLESGAWCYVIPELEQKTYDLQVACLPFEDYEAKLDASKGKLDLREMLVVSENAKTQMQELGKKSMQSLFTAAFQKNKAATLGNDLKNVEGIEGVLQTLTDNLFSDEKLTIQQVEFQVKKSSFGELTYPETKEESWIGMELTMEIECEYTGNRESDDESVEEKKSIKKEAKMNFRYEKGKCTIANITIPNIL